MALGWALSDHGDATVGIELATWAAPLFVGLLLLGERRGWCERARVDRFEAAPRIVSTVTDGLREASQDRESKTAQRLF
ncbi:hypothetical protein [Bradyrhizobium sp.]|uniref:hypothetical protein n=1 Tax=Bradyrhizobium sp. TaxID=376 RepID=UPI003BAE1B3C